MKVVQISVLAKVSGNVNADEVIGTRITLKKMYSSAGEVLPFISARAIKFAIRQALKLQGFDIDPLFHDPHAVEALRLRDSGKPERYIDNDLFGYMVTVGRDEVARKRQAPIALSYLKALRDTPIKAEFAGRFPRPGVKYAEEEELAPVPFEVEVAEFIGRLNCIIYDYVGKFEEKELDEESKKSNILEKRETENGKIIYELKPDERKRRIEAFALTFLTPTYVLPRATNSLNIPEYIAAIIALSEKGPLPIFQYLDYNFEENRVDIEVLKKMMDRKEIKESKAQFFLIDYQGNISEIPEKIEKTKDVKTVVDKIVEFL